MFGTIQHRFALSKQGAKDLCKGICWTVGLNLVLMLPAVFLFVFLKDYLQPVLSPGSSPLLGVWYYVILGTSFLAVMYLVAVQQYRNTYTSVYAESAIRRISLAEKLRKLPLAFFGEKNLSDLTATIMDDCTDLEHTFSHAVPQLIASLICMVLVAAGMSACDWRLSLALFWVVPAALAIVLLAKRMLHRNNRRTYFTRRDVSEQIQEGLDTICEIKACNREAEFLRELDERVDTNERIQTRGELLIGVLVNGAQGLLKLGPASVILVGAGLLAAKETDLLTYLFFLAVGFRVYTPINEVLNNLAALFYLDVRIDRMNEMEAMPIQQGRTDFHPKNFDIEFDDVDFSYESGRPILKQVSFTARQGEITALVGPSGGGKSTAVKLAARFWDIQHGTIRLGGEDISGIDPETLLRNYSAVFQDVVLFNASIRDNIRIGRQNASEDEILRAARLTCCDEFVRRMPQGYDTVIGENGETLSGGERQRISIARALLKDAPIVLLDEATASLDAENETKIQAGISELIRNRTVLVIAHRMRTVIHADRIVVMDNGHIAESGSPEDLLRQDGIFARMVNTQQGKRLQYCDCAERGFLCRQTV